jgi:hypothetical protein
MNFDELHPRHVLFVVNTVAESRSAVAASCDSHAHINEHLNRRLEEALISSRDEKWVVVCVKVNMIHYIVWRTATEVKVIGTFE